MNVPLLPKSAMELLSTTLRLYSRNLVKFAVLSLPAPVALLLYRAFFSTGTFAFVCLHGEVSTPAVLGVLLGIAMVLPGAAISAAATMNAIAALRKQREVSIAEAYRALGSRFWAILAIMLRVSLRISAVFALSLLAGVVFLGTAAALGFNSRVEAGVIGYVSAAITLTSAVLLSAWIAARFSFAVQVAVVEKAGSSAALQRSTLLTAGQRGLLAGVHFAFLFLVLAFDFLFGAPTLCLLNHPLAFRIASAAAGFMAAALATPIATISASLLYHQLSRRPIASGD
jgi:hypothetical protein